MSANIRRVQVRRANDADVDDIARILRESFTEYLRLYTRAGYAATTPDASALRARLSEGPVWVATIERDAVGTVAAMTSERGVYVRSMAVTPASRGRGAAGALMRELEVFAAERAAPRLFLSTTPFLFDAIRFYERLGFRRTGEPPHALAGTPLVTMEKRLR